MNGFVVLVIVSFSLIHFLEYLSFYSRVAGSLSSRPVTGYAIQSATTTITRFFYLVLMPILGYIVDKGIPRADFLLMGVSALLGAAGLSLVAYSFRYFWISVLVNFINKNKKSTAQLVRASLANHSRFPVWHIILMAGAVFFCYALGVLLSYFFALVFHEYRSTISQLSGLINGVATVLLTFALEPRVARIVDQHTAPDVYAAIQAMLTGRVLAVGIAAPAVFAAVCSLFL